MKLPQELIFLFVTAVGIPKISQSSISVRDLDQKSKYWEQNLHPVKIFLY